MQRQKLISIDLQLSFLDSYFTSRGQGRGQGRKQCVKMWSSFEAAFKPDDHPFQAQKTSLPSRAHCRASTFSIDQSAPRPRSVCRRIKILPSPAFFLCCNAPQKRKKEKGRKRKREERKKGKDKTQEKTILTALPRLLLVHGVFPSINIQPSLSLNYTAFF